MRVVSEWRDMPYYYPCSPIFSYLYPGGVPTDETSPGWCSWNVRGHNPQGRVLALMDSTARESLVDGPLHVLFQRQPALRRRGGFAVFIR